MKILAKINEKHILQVSSNKTKLEILIWVVLIGLSTNLAAPETRDNKTFLLLKTT